MPITLEIRKATEANKENKIVIRFPVQDPAYGICGDGRRNQLEEVRTLQLTESQLLAIVAKGKEALSL